MAPPAQPAFSPRHKLVSVLMQVRIARHEAWSLDLTSCTRARGVKQEYLRLWWMRRLGSSRGCSGIPSVARLHYGEKKRRLREQLFWRAVSGSSGARRCGRALHRRGVSGSVAGRICRKRGNSGGRVNVEGSFRKYGRDSSACASDTAREALRRLVVGAEEARPVCALQSHSGT